ELAKLPPLEYEKRRQAEADELGVRMSALDQAVRKQQAHSHDEASALPHWKVEPWADAVPGAELLAAIRKEFETISTSWATPTPKSPTRSMTAPPTTGARCWRSPTWPAMAGRGGRARRLACCQARGTRQRRSVLNCWPIFGEHSATSRLSVRLIWSP